MTSTTSPSLLTVPDLAWSPEFSRAREKLSEQFVRHHEGYRRIRPELMPLVVSADLARQMWDTTRACVERLRRTVEQHLADPRDEAFHRLGYSAEQAKQFVSNSCPQELDAASAFARADFVLGEAGPCLVEVNVGPTIGGIGILDLYADVADTVLGDTAARFDAPQATLPRPAAPWARALAQFIGSPRESAGNRAPRIVLAVTDEEADIPIPHDAARFIAAEGFDTTVARTERIRFREDRAWVDDRPVDCVYGCFTYDEILTPRYQVFVEQALRCADAGGPVYVAPPVFSLFGNKAVLTDGDDPVPLGVPSTRTLTTDLLSWARAERERLVLKPAIGYGGRDVVIGPQVSADLWERRLTQALERPHVLQRYVAPNHVDLPGEDGRAAPFEVGLGCLYINGDFGGFLARCAPSGAGGVVNVHRGATFGSALCEPFGGNGSP